MRTLRASFGNRNVRSAVWILLCFSLTSGVYLTWLYHLVDLVGGTWADRISMIAGYLLQAAGTGLVMYGIVKWGEGIKPIATEAYNGPGTFAPGEWCRFCKGREICKARADYFMSLEAFEDSVPEGGLTPEQKFEIDKALILGQPTRTTLTDAEVGELLIKGEKLASWLSDLQSYALQAILDGKPIPGWKVVEGKSNRVFTDVDEAIKAVQAAGYDEAMCYERKPKTITQFEKLMGKKEFAEKIGAFVTKPMGKPTLVEESDGRDPYNPLAADAAGLQ